MAPSQLQIATSSLQRLLKEEASYYKEQQQQEERISKLEKESDTGDDNREFVLKQEVCSSRHSKCLTVFVPTRTGRHPLVEASSLDLLTCLF